MSGKINEAKSDATASGSNYAEATEEFLLEIDKKANVLKEKILNAKTNVMYGKDVEKYIKITVKEENPVIKYVLTDIAY